MVHRMLILLLLTWVARSAIGDERVTLEFAPAAVANPCGQRPNSQMAGQAFVAIH